MVSDLNHCHDVQYITLMKGFEEVMQEICWTEKYINGVDKPKKWWKMSFFRRLLEEMLCLNYLFR